MTTTDAAAQLLALALERGMHIGLRVQQGERKVLHLRLRSGEETRCWARSLCSDEGLPHAIEELCGVALSTCAQRPPAPVAAAVLPESRPFPRRSPADLSACEPIATAARL